MFKLRRCIFSMLKRSVPVFCNLRGVRWQLAAGRY